MFQFRSTGWNRGLRVPVLTMVGLGLLGGLGCHQGGHENTYVPVVHDFHVDHAAIEAGEETRLKAIFANGAGKIDQGVGPVEPNAYVTVAPKVTTTYTITVGNPGKPSATRKVQVVVKPMLTITFTGLEGVKPDADLQGPSYPKGGLEGDTTLRELKAGTYRIEARPVVHEGRTLHPLKPRQVFNVDTATSITVAYGAPDLVVALPGGVALDFVTVPAGTFIMGDPKGAPSGGHLEASPQINVTLAKPFRMGRFLVTLEQWSAVTGDPLEESGGHHRKRGLSYQDIQTRFLPELNRLHPGHDFRMPSEAEWEYVCWAGTRGTQELWKDTAEPHDFPEPYPFHTLITENPANPWGVFQMTDLGLTWCEDSAVDGLQGAGRDGTPRVFERIDQRVLRGRLTARRDEPFTTRRYAQPESYRHKEAVFRIVCNK